MGHKIDHQLTYDKLTLSYSVYGSDDAIEQHDRLECDVGEEVFSLPFNLRGRSLFLENDFRYILFLFLIDGFIILHNSRMVIINFSLNLEY